MSKTRDLSSALIAISLNTDKSGISSAQSSAITSNTNTSSAALPKAGGTMTGNIAHASNFTLDVGGAITLDADSGNVKFADAGTVYGQLQNGNGSQFIMQGMISNQDMFFKVNDGGSTINAITIDASAAGASTFNSSVTATQVEIGNGSAGGTSEILFSDNASARGKIKYNHGSNPEVMTLETTGTTGLSIDNSQNVSIPNGNLTLGDNNKAIFGAGSDLQIYHDGTRSYVDDAGAGSLWLRGGDVAIKSTASETMAEFANNGAVTLYHDNALKFATASTGIAVTGTVTSDGLSLGDFTDALTIGDSDDLSIYHASGNATIKNDTGDLTVRSNSFRVKNNANSEEMFSAYADGGVTLFHNNASKLLTNSAGVTVTGTATVGNSSIGSNSSHLANLTINNNGNIGSAHNTSAIQIVTGGDVKFDQKVVANSSSSGDYVRMYAGSGTGKWDIYGSGANLRFSDNDSAGSVQFDTGVSITGATTSSGQVKVTSSSASAPAFSVGDASTGFYNTGTNSIGLSINGANAIQVNNSGNVGIGITSLSSGYGASHALQIASVSDNNWGGTLVLSSANGTSVLSRLVASTSGFDIINEKNTPTRIFANNTERLRINANARICINGSATTNGHGNFVGEAGAGSKALMFEHTVGGGETGSITTGSSSTAYNTSSDYRLKTDAQPMTGASARVQALNPVNFEWISDGTRVDGFLAHEAQAVVPESVHGTKDAVDDDGTPEYQGIDQSKLVPLLTAALQEALTEIASLKTRVEALEA